MLKCRLTEFAAKLLVASALAAPFCARAAGTGGMAGSYLQIPVSAAATALGGAYTAAPDYFAGWWNPASIATLRETRMAAGTALRSLDRSDAYASIDFRVPPRVGVGLFLLYRGDNNISGLRDAEENILPTAKFTTVTFKGAVSYYATRRLSLGACFNVFYQSLPAMEDGLGGISYNTATSTGSFDFSAVYRLIPGKWTLGAVLRNIGAKTNWSIGTDNSGFDLSYSNLPSLTLGSSYLTTLGGKPLLWNLDCRSWLFADSTGTMNQGGVDLSTGAEWRRWDNFYIRAGVGELPLNSDLLHNSEIYKLEFSPRFSAGFAYNLSKYIHKRMWVNYAASTDRIWAGLDHNLDVAVAF